MRFVLAIECDNDAFEPPNRGPELRRVVLSALEAYIVGGKNVGRLQDSNGNTVGSFSMGTAPAVVVEVRGGVVQDVTAPKGITVRVWDYDSDPAEVSDHEGEC